ncbi:unnamed protein product [Danaus chrysippus]|uniref:(African queen) hypothetical protein n=1 Tax=Danaus chrysippus TaxID=151541 RepID=A0A8J2QW15_9NEOP|nr:unnamed protein product [Danaus chrysippus]
MSKEKYLIVSFAGDNYNVWEFRLKSILRDNGAIEAIEKEDFSKSTDNKQLEAKAQAIIIAATADSHLEYLKDRSAYQMIKSMEDSFKEKGTRSKLFIRRELSDMKFDERKPLMEHFIDLEKLFAQLGDAGSELSEEEKVNYLLLSMPKSYEGIITALETVEELKLDFVKNRLLGEEEKRNRGVTKSVESSIFSCYGCGRPGHKKFQWRSTQQARLKTGDWSLQGRGCSNWKYNGGRDDSKANHRQTQGRGRGKSFLTGTENTEDSGKWGF